MAQTRKNPFNPEKVSSTLYALTGLALGTKELKQSFSSGDTLLSEVQKMPDPSDPKNYNPWMESLKKWISLYIQNTQNGLPPIGDLARKMELIDVLRASLKSAEIQDLDPALNKLKENFQKFQEARDKLREENKNYTTTYTKQGKEALKVISLQPSMGPNLDSIYIKQTESQRLLRINLGREREKLEKIKGEATHLLGQLSHRIPAEKVREIEEKTQEEKPGMDFSASG